MDNALIALRNKYAEDLEDILACPVCFERLTRRIPVCTQGHHICSQCLPLMTCCPVCKENFNGTRNYLAENLLIKFDEIKNSLIDPQHALNQTVLQNKICVGTQTDTINNNEQMFITNLTNTVSNAFKDGPVVGKGKYPCRIGDCTEQLPHGRMIPHIRYYHKANVVEEKMISDGSYQNSWEVEYKLNDRFDRAISIPNMGLFFLNITIDDQGDLRGSLQVANTTMIAQQFTYEMTVSHSHSSISYKGNAIACRSAQTKLSEKSLFVNNAFMKILLKKRKVFTCFVEITRHLESSLKKGSSKSSLMST